MRLKYVSKDDEWKLEIMLSRLTQTNENLTEMKENILLLEKQKESLLHEIDDIVRRSVP